VDGGGSPGALGPVTSSFDHVTSVRERGLGGKVGGKAERERVVGGKSDGREGGEHKKKTFLKVSTLVYLLVKSLVKSLLQESDVRLPKQCLYTDIYIYIYIHIYICIQ